MSDVIESRMIPTMNENAWLVDITFSAVKLERSGSGIPSLKNETMRSKE